MGVGDGAGITITPSHLALRALSNILGLQSTASEIDGAIIGSNDLAFIGDSRCASGEGNYFKLATISNLYGISLVPKGAGVGCSVNGNGTLEFRASDKSFRWTAPSDTAGAWTPITQAGDMMLQSGTADKWLLVMLRSVLTLPLTDQILTVALSGSMISYLCPSSTMALQVMSYFRFNQQFKAIGCSGANTSDGVELLPYWKQQAGAKGGIDVIRMGTNDPFSDVSVTIANMTTIFKARLALGRKLVICGEPPKWGAAVGTPLTASDIARYVAMSKAYKEFALANPSTCIYVDLFSLGSDPAYTDYRPRTGILRDVVHDGYLGSFVFGNAIATAVKQLGLQGDSIYPNRASKLNLLSTGYMTGTSGTNGTGSSGPVPNGIDVSRSVGSDATVVNSIETITDPYATNKLVSAITGISAGNIIKVNMGVTTLATVGLVAGDTITLSADLIVSALTGSGLTDLSMFVYFNDPLLLRSQIAVPPIVGANSKVRSCPIKVPAGATYAVVQVWATPAASSTATIKLSDVELKKVP